MADAITLKIDADARKAKKEIKSLGGGIKSMSASSGAALASSGIAAGLAAISAGAVAGVAAMVSLTNSAGKAGDGIAKMARIVGVTGEQLQELRFAAERSGVSAATMEASMKKLSKSMFDSTMGSKTMMETFRGMGISVTDASGKMRSSVDVLRDIADHAKTATDRTKLTGEMMSVLGRSGADLTNLLMGGSEALDEYADRLHELGGVMSEESLIAAEAYEDALTDLSTSINGTKLAIGSELLPTMTELVNFITDNVLPATKTLATSIADLPRFFADLGGAFLDAIPGMSKFADALDRINERERIQAERRERQRATIRSRELSAAAGVPEDIDISGIDTGVVMRTAAPSKPVASGVPAPSRRKSPVAKKPVAAGPGFGVSAGADPLAFLDATHAEMNAVQGLDEVKEQIAQNDAERAAASAERHDRRMQHIREEAELVARTERAQQDLANETFQAVATFAALGQQAVEDSEFGKTRAGKTAAKILFVTGKAAAIAQASVNAALAISNTLATVAPPPAAAAAAAAMGVAAAAQIAVIVGTTIQGLADAGLAPGALKAAGLNNHTMIAMRNDEAVIDPVGTREITTMLSLQRRQMEMDLSGQSRGGTTSVSLSLDGRRLTRGLMPYQTGLAEDGHDWRTDVRGVA